MTTSSSIKVKALRRLIRLSPSCGTRCPPVPVHLNSAYSLYFIPPPLLLQASGSHESNLGYREATNIRGTGCILTAPYFAEQELLRLKKTAANLFTMLGAGMVLEGSWNRFWRIAMEWHQPAT
jgi:hypothetical protein